MNRRSVLKKVAAAAAVGAAVPVAKALGATTGSVPSLKWAERQLSATAPSNEKYVPPPPDTRTAQQVYDDNINSQFEYLLHPVYDEHQPKYMCYVLPAEYAALKIRLGDAAQISILKDGTEVIEINRKIVYTNQLQLVASTVSE